MSKEAIKYVSKIEVKSPSTRAILRAIARKTFNDSGMCRVGIEGLKEETGYSQRSIIRHVKALEDLKIIVVHKRLDKRFARGRNDIEVVGFKASLQPQQEGVLHTQDEPLPCANDDTSPCAKSHVPSCQSTYAILSDAHVPMLSVPYIEVNNTSKIKRQVLPSDGIPSAVRAHEGVGVCVGADPREGQMSASATRVSAIDPVTEDDWQSLERELTSRYDLEDYTVQQTYQDLSGVLRWLQ